MRKFKVSCEAVIIITEEPEVTPYGMEEVEATALIMAEQQLNITGPINTEVGTILTRFHFKEIIKD